MTSLNDIIQIQISKSTQVVSEAGFGVPMILGSKAATVFTAGEYVRTYSDTAAMLTDGFLSTDKEYKIAAALMSQSKRPQSFMVGVHTTPTKEILKLTFTGTLASGSVSVVINGTTYTQAYATSEAATMGALATAIQADSLLDTCVFATGVLTITSGAGEGINFGGVPSKGNYSAVAFSRTAGTATIESDVANIDMQMADWYALLLASTSYDDIIAAAQLVETQRRIFGFDEISKYSLTVGETLTASQRTFALSLEHTAAIYNPVRTEYKAAAWFGRVLPEEAGSENWAYKTLAGCAVYKLTTTEESALSAKNVNRYIAIGGLPSTIFGQMSNGQYLDIIRGEHWLTSRIQERIYSRLHNDTIPFTDKGIAIVENDVYSILKSGIAQGLISDDGKLAVTSPLYADISTVNKGNRNLPDVKFYGTLQGRINKVSISGTLSL
jgi:hypothetical protein